MTMASVGILSLSDGGVMATDEAHTVLGHADTVQLNYKMMREGRSLNVGLIYASQLPSDVLSKGMETYISRVFAMALDDDAEAAAAIKLVGFEVTDERIRMLRDAGPRRRTADYPGRAAVSLHRDLGGGARRSCTTRYRTGVPGVLHQRRRPPGAQQAAARPPWRRDHGRERWVIRLRIVVIGLAELGLPAGGDQPGGAEVVTIAAGRRRRPPSWPSGRRAPTRDTCCSSSPTPATRQ